MTVAAAVGELRRPAPTVSTLLAVLGVVYGDIGTSPLYALKQAAEAAGGLSAENVMGVVSLLYVSAWIPILTGLAMTRPDVPLPGILAWLHGVAAALATTFTEQPLLQSLVVMTSDDQRPSRR